MNVFIILWIYNYNYNYTVKGRKARWWWWWRLWSWLCWSGKKFIWLDITYRWHSSHVPTRVSVAVMCLIFCFCFGIFIYLFSVAFLLLFNVMYTNMDEYTRPEKISCYRNPRMTRGARLSTCQALIASCIVGPASPPIRAWHDHYHAV